MSSVTSENSSFNLVPQAFPAGTKTAASTVNGVDTNVMCIAFADRLLITISQGGRLGHWVHVALDTAAPDASMTPVQTTYEGDDSVELLPMAHLTATTVLGGTEPERNALGQLYATQIASAIATKDPAEKRTVVVGLGLEKAATDREQFMGILDLVLQCV